MLLVISGNILTAAEMLICKQAYFEVNFLSFNYQSLLNTLAKKKKVTCFTTVSSALPFIYLFASLVS